MLLQLNLLEDLLEKTQHLDLKSYILLKLIKQFKNLSGKEQIKMLINNN